MLRANNYFATTGLNDIVFLVFVIFTAKFMLSCAMHLRQREANKYRHILSSPIGHPSLHLVGRCRMAFRRGQDAISLRPYDVASRYIIIICVQVSWWCRPTLSQVVTIRIDWVFALHSHILISVDADRIIITLHLLRGGAAVGLTGCRFNSQPVRFM